MNIRLLIFGLVLLIESGHSQGGMRMNYTASFAKTHRSKAIFPLTSGYISLGITLCNSSCGSVNKLSLVGFSSSGTSLWEKHYGGVGGEFLDNSFIASSTILLNNNLYYVGCLKRPSNTYVGVLFRLSLSGDSIWQKEFVEQSGDVILQMATRSIDGGFLLTGFFQDHINSVTPTILIKTDSGGNELWRKLYHKSSPDVSDGKAIVQSPITKEIIIGGYQYDTGTHVAQNLLILDSLGLLKQKVPFSGYGGNILDLGITSDSKVIIVGTSTSSLSAGSQNLNYGFVYKMDLASPTVAVWQLSEIGKPALVNSINCVRELSGGELLVGGIIDTSTGPVNVVVRYSRISSNGNLLWTKYYSYRKLKDSMYYSCDVVSLEPTIDGGWVSALRVETVNSPDPLFFVKYDAAGCDDALDMCKGLGISEHERNFPVWLKVETIGSEVVFETAEICNPEITISNSCGMVILSRSFTEGNRFSIELDSSPGIYITTVRTNARIARKKIVVW
jgi:hypothetical protein